jgi:hypothetical protein
LVIEYRDSLLRRQYGRIAGGGLVHFSAATSRHALIGVPCRFSIFQCGSCCGVGFGLDFIRHIFSCAVMPNSKHLKTD